MDGLIHTVCGPIEPEALGVALMHEHFLWDLRRIFDEPDDPEERELAHAPILLDNLSWVARNWCRSLDNLHLSDLDLAVREARLFKEAGGGAIVDVTTCDFGRDAQSLREISVRTGLHVVMGCSHYHAQFHPEDLEAKTEHAICKTIISEIIHGVDGTDICAGIIGEVGCSWPLFGAEAKVLRASAAAQQETGASITIHPGRHVDSPFQIMDILESAGARSERIIMGHMERTGLERGRLLELAQRGCYLEYDWFGEVRPTYPHGRVDVPSDGERIKTIADLINEGFRDQILISHDVGLKHRLSAYGGPGYAHIPQYVCKWMAAMGLDDVNIKTILVENPRRALRFS